jgi:hypothetical protein
MKHPWRQNMTTRAIKSYTTCTLDQKIRTLNTQLMQAGKDDLKRRADLMDQINALKEERFERTRTKTYDRMLAALD